MKLLPVYRLFLTSIWFFLAALLLAQNNVPLAVHDQDGWYYIDYKGNRKTNVNYVFAGDFGDRDYAIVKDSGRYGVVNLQLKQIIPVEYDSIFIANQSIFIAKKNDRYFLMDENNKLLSKEGYDTITNYRSNLRVHKHNKTGIFFNEERLLLPPIYDNISLLGKDLYIINQNDRYGLINKHNKVILKPEFEYITWFNDSLIQYQKNGLWHLLDENLKPFNCKPFVKAKMINAHWLVTHNRDHATLYTYPEGKEVSSDIYDDFIAANEKFIVVMANKKLGIINQKNQLVVDTLFEEAFPYKEDLFIVKSEGYCGMINSNKDTVMPFVYHEITPYAIENDFYYLTEINERDNYLDDLLYVRLKRLKGLCNSKGDTLVPIMYQAIYPINKNFYIGKINASLFLYNQHGNLLSESANQQYYSYENLILGRRNQCFVLFNKDSLIGGLYNNKITVGNHVAKLYTDDALEVITFNANGNIYDRYVYKDIPSYTLHGNANNWIKNDTLDEYTDIYEMFFSQQMNKWGVRNKYSKQVAVLPCYDNIYNTTYPNVYKTEIHTDSIFFSVGELNFFTNTLYGYVTLTDNKIDSLAAQYVWVGLAERNAFSLLGNSTEIDPVMYLNGKFDFASNLEKSVVNGNYSYIDERYNNERRYNVNGTLELSDSPDNHFLTPLNDLVNRFNPDHKIHAADSATVYKLMNDYHNVYIKGGEWGYQQYLPCDESKKDNCIKFLQNLEPFDYVENAKGGYYIVRSGKTGALDINGKTLIPMEYERIDSVSSRDLLGISNEPLYGYLNRSETVIDQHFIAALPFSEGLAAVSDGELWGYINTKGDTTIPFMFQEALRFDHGIAKVRKDGLFGYIGKSGDWVIPNEYVMADSVAEGIVRLKKGNYYYFFTEKGEAIHQFEIKKATSFKDGYTIISESDGDNLMNALGQRVLKRPLQKITDYYSDAGIVIAKQGKNYQVYSIVSGKKLSKSYKKIEAYSDGLAVCKNKKGYGFLDTQGKETIGARFRKVRDFKNNRAAVKTKSKWGFINPKGVMIINEQMKDISDFNEGIAFLDTDSGKLALDTMGNVVFQLKGRYLKHGFNNGYAVVSESGKEYYINQKGDNVFEKTFDEAFPFINDRAQVKINGKMGVIDKYGAFIQPAEYNFIEASSNDLLLFSKGNYQQLLANKTYQIPPSKIRDAKYQKVTLIAPFIYRLTNENYELIIDRSGKIIRDSRSHY